MAKLGSRSSCRPLLQGMMMLLALLLLASIQAGPVMASGEQVVAGVVELVNYGGEKLRDLGVGQKGLEKMANKAMTELRKKNGLKDFSDGGKMGLKVHKYLCKAQGWMDKQHPGGTPVDILGGDLLPKIFPTFYYVTSAGRGNSVVTCRYADQPQVPAAGTTLVPTSRYWYPTFNPNDVRITGIRAGQEELTGQTPAGRP